MPFMFGNYVSAATQIADDIITNAKLATNALSDTKGDVGLGANKLKTTNILIKELDSGRLIVRNSADALERGIYLAELYANVGVNLGDNCYIRSVDANVAHAYLLQSYDGSAWQTTAQAVGGNLEIARGKLTGALDVNGQTLNNPGSGLPLLKFKSADETVNNSTAMQDDDDLNFTVGANEIWAVKMHLRINSAAAADLKLLFTLPTDGAITGTKHSMAEVTEIDFSAAHVIGTDGTNIGVIFHLIFRNGANAGTVQLQWAQNTADVSDTTVLTGSYLIAHRLV